MNRLFTHRREKECILIKISLKQGANRILSIKQSNAPLVKTPRMPPPSRINPEFDVTIIDFIFANISFFIVKNDIFAEIDSSKL